MKSHLAALACLAVPLPAQQEASSLAWLTDHADKIVQVRVLAVIDDGHGGARAVLRSVRALRGVEPRTFELREPGGWSCGRALRGLLRGAGYLVFLADRGPDPVLLVSGARSLVPIVPGLVEHVAALLKHPDGAGRARVLTNALDAPLERVRLDAALALPLQRDLVLPDAAAHRKLVRALERALAECEPGAPALLVAAARLRLGEALEVLVPSYLAGQSPALERVILAAIPRIDGADAARLVGQNLPADPAGRRRAVTLLGELPAAASREPLLVLFGAPDAALRREAGVALLRGGLSSADLARLADARTARECADRVASRAPAFRSIRTDGTR